MPSFHIPSTELDALLRLIVAAPKGLRLEELAAAVPTIARRSLQRRLATLVHDGRIRRQGRGPATRYCRMPAMFSESVTEQATGSDAVCDQLGIPLSEAALDIRQRISQPSTLRQPVGYRHGFLADYHPNADGWLSASTRAHLRQIGTLPDVALTAGTHSRQLLDRLLIDLSWNSSRLEGNTYSLLETRRLLETDMAADGRSPLETQMLLNHKQAIEFLVSPDAGLDRHTILSLHALLSDNLLPNPAAGGRLRASAVGIGQSVYMPPAMPQLIEEWEPLKTSRGKQALRIGMDCKAQTAAIAVAIARMCNAADRPRPQMHAARGVLRGSRVVCAVAGKGRADH